MKLIIPKNKKKKNLLPNTPIKMKSSEHKFNLGGAAIFPLQKINHHKTKDGYAVIMPFTINTLREPIKSYPKLANTNKQEEHNPCPIIIIKAPVTLTKDPTIYPAKRTAICPTEE